MKRFLPQYNFQPRVREKDDACYPYLSDEAMENLKWATASYSDVLPVLSVPVFDILRVMTTRILKRKSPFHPDKTHLHHMFIRLGCSHAATTPPLAILSLNFFVVLCWWISCMVGCSIDVQLYIVLALSILANLCVFLMNNYSGNETVNAGTGNGPIINWLTELVAKVAGYTGEIRWDPLMPNGTPRKLLDVSKAKVLGWTYKTELEDGIRLACKDFLENPMRAER